MLFTGEPITFDMFDFAPGHSLVIDDTFRVRGTGAGLIEDFSIDTATGEITFTAVVIPEPATAALAPLGLIMLDRRRRIRCRD